jgi:hypothetical protein
MLYQEYLAAYMNKDLIDEELDEEFDQLFWINDWQAYEE